MIAIAQTLLTLFALAQKVTFGLCLFFFFLAFSPRSIGLLLSEASISLTFQRLAFPIIAFLCLIAASMKRDDPRYNIRNGYLKEPIFFILVSWSFIKILSSVISDVEIVYAVESALFTILPFLIFYKFASPSLFSGISKSIIISAGVMVFFVIVEVSNGKPIHYSFASTKLFEEDILKIRESDRGYRAQGFFDNALLLSEFILMVIPFMFYKIVCSKRHLRYIYIIFFLIIWIVGLQTKSRGFLAFSLISISVFFMTYLWGKFSTKFRLVFSIILVIGFIASVVGVEYILSDLIEQASGVKFGNIEDSAMRSTFSRALQFQEVFDLIETRPIFGFGVLQNFSNELHGLHRIDSYYLRAVLESGYLGLTLFFALLASIFWTLKNLKFNHKGVENRAIFSLMCSVIVSFLGAKSFLSMPTNNIYFFALLGLFLGLFRSMEASAENARSAGS